MKGKLLSLFIILTISLSAQEHEEQKYYPPIDITVQQKLNWWKDLKFGLLMHWGPYSQWGIVESWSICPEDEDWCIRKGPYAKDYYEYKKHYENLQTTFNPVAFNPEKWAEAAKNAGMKYMVFTTKHHDGFCMFDTQQTDYKITDKKSPYSKNPKANITKEVFNAFRNQGLGIGAYFSKPDWHNENYWSPYFPPLNRHVNYNPTTYPDKWKAYKDFTYNQIEELMSNYGKVDILWLDGGWVRPNVKRDSICKDKIRFNQDIDMNRIAKMARTYQPGLIVVDRAVESEHQNYCTPEQQVPAKPLNYPWETCMTMANSWSYVPDDVYKPTRQLIHTLCKIVSRGGNYLLNIAPSPSGDWDMTAYERLTEIGKWMKINDEAIYQTHPIAPYETGKVVLTQKNTGTLYAIYLADEKEEQLPEEIILKDLKVKYKKISLLGNPKSKCKIEYITDGIIIRIPRNTVLPNKMAAVLKIE